MNKMILFSFVVLTLFICTSSYAQKNSHVYGKIKYVDYGEDYKVKIVKYNEDLRVKIVKRPASRLGEWQIVDYGEDYKIKLVDYGEDFKVKIVN